MSVNAAGSAQNVQQALYALRQTVQAEQVAAAALSEAATEAAKQSAQVSPDQQPAAAPAETHAPVEPVAEGEKGPGANLDVKA